MSPPSLAGIFPEPAAVPHSCRPGRSWSPLEQRQYLCDGRLCSWSGPVREVFSPICLAAADGSGASPHRLGSYPLLGAHQAEEALAAAGRAYDRGRGEWPSMAMAGRIERVERLLYAMESVRVEVERLLMWEIGKSREEAALEFARTLEYVRDTIDELRRREGEAGPRPEQGFLALRRRAPLGIALCLGPYNNPFYETFTILIPALLMGNTAIFKPPRLGALLHGLLLPALRDCFPPGVVNCLYGEVEAVLAPLLRSGRLDLLAFIGSRRAADTLYGWHPAPRRLRCLMGLEAKNAAIVLADADREQAAAECVLGALAFNGQRCTALKMIFVQRPIIEPFLAELVRQVNRQPVGMPWRESVRITPLPEPARVHYLQELLADALAKGAKIINEGGGEVCHTLMIPAVLYPVTPDMRLYHEEQFGPLVPVAPFDDPEEPRRYVSESEFGQQVSIFGEDEAALAALAGSLLNQVGRVNLNRKCQRGPDCLPFTARRNSATGTMAVAATLEACSIDSLVVSRDCPAARRTLQTLELS